MNFELTHLVKLYWWKKKKRKAFYLSLHVLFSRKCLLRTILLRLQLETGLTFYMVIRAMWRSGRLQGKGSTVHSFLSYQTLSIGLTLGDEPMPYILQPWMHLTPKICWEIKVFPLVVIYIYIDSQNLSSWLCMNIVRRKLRLVTLGTLRVN